MPVSDNDVVERFQLHEPLLRAYITSQLPKRLRSLVDPEDILQETYSDAWHRIGDYRGGSMSAWLKSVARNKIIDRVRAQGAQKRGGDFNRMRVATAQSSSGVALPAKDLTPSGVVSDAEMKAYVQSCISELSPRYQKAIAHRFLEQKSVEEVANEMEISAKAAQMLLQRAIAQLRTRLRQNSSDFRGSR